MGLKGDEDGGGGGGELTSGLGLPYGDISMGRGGQNWAINDVTSHYPHKLCYGRELNFFLKMTEDRR